MTRPTDWPPPIYDVPLAQALHDIGAGRRKWPSDPDKKRHHFVARFILSNFATARKSGAERLSQLDKRTGRSLRVRPEEAASRKRFYAVESDESPRDNRIEDFLSLVEGYAADPIRTLLDRPMKLTEADRTTISLLLALQERRTPYGIAEAGAAVENFGRDYMAALAREPERFAAMWGEFSSDDASPSDVEDARQEMLAIATQDRLHLSNQREQGLLMMLQGWLATAERIDLMRWLLLRPAPGFEFIQNDQGVARLDSSTAFSTPRLTPQWLFPLAPDALLMVCEGARSLSVRGITPQGMIDANLRVYGWAEHFVFARSQQALQEVRIAAKAQPRKAAGPPRPPPRSRR